MQSFDRDHHDLIVGVEVFAWQRPYINACAVFCQEFGSGFGQMMLVDHPHHHRPRLRPLPAVPQIAKLDALIVRCLRVMVIRGIDPQQPEGFSTGRQALDIALHRLLWTEPRNAISGAVVV